ncbi:MAG: hypothetical protein LH473_11310 [Chitinophagales bacterium]|nr:hypothetical protein [Chitinophagales bacterium]
MIWEQYYDAGDPDQEGLLNHVVAVSGGYIASGNKNISSTNHNVLIIKINTGGALISGYPKLYGNSNLVNIGNNIGAGGYAFIEPILNAGTITGYIVGATAVSNAQAGFSADGALLIKLNPDGTLNTTDFTNGYKIYSNTAYGYSTGYHVICINNASNTTQAFAFAGNQISSSSEPDAFVIKTNLNGVELWHNIFSESSLGVNTYTDVNSGS